MHAGHLAPFRFTRRQVGEQDIKIKIAYCGICHSDLHQLHNDWRNTKFPLVPGCVQTSDICARQTWRRFCCFYVRGPQNFRFGFSGGHAMQNRSTFAFIGPKCAPKLVQRFSVYFYCATQQWRRNPKWPWQCCKKRLSRCLRNKGLFLVNRHDIATLQYSEWSVSKQIVVPRRHEIVGILTEVVKGWCAAQA